MASSKFSIREVIVVSVILVVVISVALVWNSGRNEIKHRVECATNLAGIYKAMYTYSTTNRDRFAKYATAGTTAQAFGFREDRARSSDTRPNDALTDNVSAALWILVRDGSLGPKSYVCPSDSRATPDPLTTLDASGGFTSTRAKVPNTFDFGNANALSYSPINMYDPYSNREWNADVNPAWILLADNNDNSAADRHTRGFSDTKNPATQGDIQRAENSSVHRRDGQNMIFGDSHVMFSHPFEGPSSDNIYALDTDKDIATQTNAAPTLSNHAVDMNNRKTDVVLLPITGNGGGEGSLDPKD